MTYKNNKKVALLLVIEERDEIANLVRSSRNNSITILSIIASYLQIAIESQ